MPGFLFGKIATLDIIMKTLILFIILCFSVCAAFCQRIIIKYGTESTYSLAKIAGKKFTLTLVDTKAIDGDVGLTNDFLKSDVDSTQIKFVFGGNKKNNRTEVFLIMKTGRKGMIKYTAKIKAPDASGFVNTDVNMIVGTVKTVEIWQNDIAEIMLSDFEEGSF
jgi:hypothetical protein